MAKTPTITTLASLANESSAVTVINQNFENIRAIFEDFVSRDPANTPNTFLGDLDANSNKIVNLEDPTNNQDAATKAYADSIGAGTQGDPGENGTDGDDGWAPILAVVSDGERRVLQIVDWTGGSGTEPSSTDQYIGASGIVGSAGAAVDIRGAQGTSGAGTGDLLAANNLSDVASASTSRTNLGLGTIATQAASNVSITGGTMAGVTITGGSISGMTDIAIADGGTGASTAATAFAALKQAASSTETGVLEIATIAEVRSAATGDKALTAQLIEEASASVTLTDGATISLDWDAGIYRSLTIGGNRSISNPTNGQPGTWRYIKITQDGTGSRTLSWGSQYLFAGGTDVVLSTAAGSIDFMAIFCSTTSQFLVFPNKAFA